MKITREDGITHVQYTEGKRPLKIGVYWIDGPESDAFLDEIIGFVTANANAPEHIAKMEPAKYWALIERLSTMVCYEFSPTTNYGVTKPEIRGAVYFVLNEGLRVGEWPTEYKISRETFVQYGGGYGG